MDRADAQHTRCRLASTRLSSTDASCRAVSCRSRSLVCRHRSFPGADLVTPATANNQYRSYLARVRDCVRLLAALRRDATGNKQNAQHVDAAQVRAEISQQGEPK